MLWMCIKNVNDSINELKAYECTNIGLLDSLSFIMLNVISERNYVEIRYLLENFLNYLYININENI